MILSQKEIIDRYEREKGKLILDFDKSRYDEYVRIIENTNEYKDIIDSIPDNVSKLAKIYYVYCRLGKILTENNNLVYDHLRRIGIYYDVIQPKRYRKL